MTIPAVPADRDAALKTAEKLLRQGKLDAAISEYVRLVADYPRDWASINALGDLYARAGQTDRAIQQFSRVADFLFEQGIYPKAQALYTKALRLDAAHEPTVLRLADIATRQGAFADARTHLRTLEQIRRDHGDDTGAAQYLVRIGQLQDADSDARLAAARAAETLGDSKTSSTLLLDVADAYEAKGRADDAFELRVAAAGLDEENVALRTRMARECVARGDLDRARIFLVDEAIGDDPDLLLAAAAADLSAGRDDRAGQFLTRLLTQAPARAGDVLKLGEQLATRGLPEYGFRCVDLVVDAALLEGDMASAADALRSFTAAAPHIPALEKLVEVTVDGGFKEIMREAQTRLAAAYEAAGRLAEAKAISDDLAAASSDDDELLAELAALSASGFGLPGGGEDDAATPGEGGDAVSEPENRQAEASADPPPFGDDAQSGANDRRASARHVATPALDAAVAVEVVELDLTDSLIELSDVHDLTDAADDFPDADHLSGAPDPLAMFPTEAAAATAGSVATLVPAAVTPAVAAPTPPLEAVFQQFRAEAQQTTAIGAAGERFTAAHALLSDGRIEEARAAYEAAASSPTHRFVAAAALGRLYLAERNVAAAVSWLERAAQAPAPAAEDGWALLYDLATALERLGESARALAILLELDLDSPGYRDVADRIRHLTGGAGSGA